MSAEHIHRNDKGHVLAEKSKAVEYMRPPLPVGSKVKAEDVVPGMVVFRAPTGLPYRVFAVLPADLFDFKEVVVELSMGELRPRSDNPYRDVRLKLSEFLASDEWSLEANHE